MKKLFSVFSFVVFFIISSIIVNAYFADVSSDDHYEEAISYVYNEGIVSGYSDNTYKPDDEITRGEFTKIIVGSIADEDEINLCTTNYFFDVAPTNPFRNYICVAKERGIISGYSNGEFKPNLTITVGESAKILVNAFELNLTEKPSLTNNKFEIYLATLMDSNFIPDTISNVANKLTRGEMAEYIYRIKNDITDKQSVYYGDLFEYFCGFCGFSCVPLTNGMMCPAVMPVEYTYCIRDVSVTDTLACKAINPSTI